MNEEIKKMIKIIILGDISAKSTNIYVIAQNSRQLVYCALKSARFSITKKKFTYVNYFQMTHKKPSYSYSITSYQYNIIENKLIKID